MHESTKNIGGARDQIWKTRFKQSGHGNKTHSPSVLVYLSMICGSLWRFIVYRSRFQHFACHANFHVNFVVAYCACQNVFICTLQDDRGGSKFYVWSFNANKVCYLHGCYWKSTIPMPPWQPIASTGIWKNKFEACPKPLQNAVQQNPFRLMYASRR